MKARKLIFGDDGTLAGLYACSVCGLTWLGEEEAEACCVCRQCGVQSKGNILCQPCRRRRSRERDWEAAFKARRCELTDFEMLYDPFEDRFLEPAQVMDRSLDGEMGPFVFGTTGHRLQLDIESALENGLEEHHEGADWQDYEGLVSFVEEWNKKQTDRSFFEDRTKIVVLNDHDFLLRRAQMGGVDG